MMTTLNDVNHDGTAKYSQINVNQPNSKAQFDVKAFLEEGKTRGYAIHASDGKPFLVKYKETLIKEGKLFSLVIWLIDVNISEKDLIRPCYFSETFSHFFRNSEDTFEDYSCSKDGGLMIAEIALSEDESGLLYLIDDLNYKHIAEFILNKYYASYKGEYDYIGRSIVGIAGRILKEVYGARFLGVKTDKTKGFYWGISGHPPNKPAIPVLIGYMEHVKSIETKREVRENLYTNIINNIIHRRFDPYTSISSDTDIDDAWESHCREILRILSDKKHFLSQLLDTSNSVIKVRGVDKFIDRIMMDYRANNSEWFNSICIGMRGLFEAQQSRDKNLRDKMIDEMMSIEEDPIVKNVLNRLKQEEISIDIISLMHRMLSRYDQIFPIIDLEVVYLDH